MSVFKYLWVVMIAIGLLIWGYYAIKDVVEKAKDEDFDIKSDLEGYTYGFFFTVIFVTFFLSVLAYAISKMKVEGI